MIYKITKDKMTYNIDDLILYSGQSKEFRDLFSEIAVADMAEFDNANVLVFETGRVIVTEKGGGNE